MIAFCALVLLTSKSYSPQHPVFGTLNLCCSVMWEDKFHTALLIPIWHSNAVGIYHELFSSLIAVRRYNVAERCAEATSSKQQAIRDNVAFEIAYISVWTVHTGKIAISLLKLSLIDRRYMSEATFLLYRLSLWRGVACSGLLYHLVIHVLQHVTVNSNKATEKQGNIKFVMKWSFHSPTFSQTSNLVALVWLYRRYDIAYRLLPVACCLLLRFEPCVSVEAL
jgi:hypothetical protein